MVSVAADPDDGSNRIVASQLNALKQRIAAAGKLADLDGLFAYHVISHIDAAAIPWNVTPDADTYRRSAASGNAPHAAVLGFGLSDFTREAPPDARDQLLPNLEAIMRRDPFPRDGLTFIHDERVIVGLGLAARAAAGVLPGFGDWLRDTLTDERLSSGTLYIQLIRHHVVQDVGGLGPLTVDLTALNTAPELAAAQWTTDRGTSTVGGPHQPYQLQRAVIRAGLAADPNELTIPHAALVYAGMQRGLDLVADEVTINRSHLGVILRRFESAMRRWRHDPADATTRITWDVQSEREVQDILTLVLVSAFGSDVIDEDTLPKFGHASYRADFGIPRLGVIIEVKYARTASDFKEIEKQVMEDSVGYLQDTTRYRELVVFIYDNSSSVQHHDLAATAISRIPGVTDIIIVSRPSQIPPPPPRKAQPAPAKRARPAKVARPSIAGQP